MFGIRKTQLKEIDDNVIYSPMSGKKERLEEVNDVVFSKKMMGDGIAIIPESDELYSPVNGKVSVVFPTGHVVGIEADNGAYVIIHVGIDTVKLNGKGFNVKVKQGKEVKVGDLLMKLDLDYISSKYDPTTMVVIENSNDFKIEDNVIEEVKSGDKLFTLKRN